MRHAGNPILTPQQWPYPVGAVFNPAAVRSADGQTILLCRVEDRTGHSHLTAARSTSGLTGWRIDPSPTLAADPDSFPEELWGIEDPRITWLPERNEFAVVYTSYGEHGPAVSLALTQDFQSFRRVGNILPPVDKDAALFPKKVNGRWMMFHRPDTADARKHIWISFSPDLTHWGERALLLPARRGGWWDANKIGLSTPPIETRDGWLIIYHGVRETVSGSIYRLGLALLDLDDPTQCLVRSTHWFMGPAMPEERVGDVGNVVFPCGHTICDDGDTIRLYYGMADSAIGVASGSIKQMMEWLRNHAQSPSYGAD